MYLQNLDVVKDILCNEPILFDCKELLNASRVECTCARTDLESFSHSKAEKKTQILLILTGSTLNRLRNNNRRMITSHGDNSENEWEGINFT